MTFKTQILTKTCSWNYSWKQFLIKTLSKSLICWAKAKTKQAYWCGIIITFIILLVFSTGGFIFFITCLLFLTHSGVSVTVEFSRNCVYMECSHEQRGQDFGPRNRDGPAQGPRVMNATQTAWLSSKVYVRLTYFGTDRIFLVPFQFAVNNFIYL